MSGQDELENFKLQLEQVEAALLKDRNNPELLKLKGDLQEVINLQLEIIANDARNGDGDGSVQWKVGDRVQAKGNNGQYYHAIIDGISGTTASVTFLGNKQQILADLNSLKMAPVQEKGVFEDKRKGGLPGGSGRNFLNKTQQEERERKRLKSQKKEMKRKELDNAKESEKNDWKKFNTKANNKRMKGIKKVAVSGAAPDGPSGGVKRDPKEELANRSDPHLFHRSAHGNMYALF